jgi:hypothetical protein
MDLAVLNSGDSYSTPDLVRLDDGLKPDREAWLRSELEGEAVRNQKGESSHE